MTTADDAASVPQDKPKKKRFNLAPVQKFGRSLMLPIAVLPAASPAARAA